MVLTNGGLAGDLRRFDPHSLPASSASSASAARQQPPTNGQPPSRTRSPPRANDAPPPSIAPPPALPASKGNAHSSASELPPANHRASASSSGGGRASTSLGSLASPEATDSSVEAAPEHGPLRDLIDRTSANVVRQVVREKWTKCLLGSEFHLAFIASGIFSRATTTTLEQPLQRYGGRMIREAKGQVVQHLTAQDLDEVADALLANASNDFLDKALARRLETIRPRPLVNALARAERLGYDLQDIVEEKSPDGAEHVVPSPHLTVVVAAPAPSSSTSATVPHRQLPTAPPARPPVLSGGVHVAKWACEHTLKFDLVGQVICLHCGCFFTSNGGLAYHLRNKVCGDHDEAAAMAVRRELHAMSLQLAGKAPAHFASAMATPVSNPTPPRTTPGQRSAATATPTPTPSTTTPQSAGAVDPYARLTPAQRAQLETEMQLAEAKFGCLMRNAMQLPPDQRDGELAKLKNSYTSKQSMIRKKYGIRLRERRSKSQIDAEKSRLFGSSATEHQGSVEGRPPSAKRARLDGGQTGAGAGVGVGVGVGMGVGAGPANPSGRRIALAEIAGGLSDSAATAEHTDPTTLTPFPKPRFTSRPPPPPWMGTPDNPMRLDDSSNAESGASGDDGAGLPKRSSA
ncbi:hypothetical protein DCS_05638 [Drechmeria coniospora]|uniref:Uncharacterized protein n=1 Tax=Drechmeria coniospora TaxID=98403 RepID=A0A151GNK9_DRECN|nr:hypothetical protein DCS_05638 [Drechmeria coniospora]KYK58621.1 hypothetical protein DCS_05638 [Drechmeria coniospora]